MGLFKTIYCAECGIETKPLFRTKLKDGNYICSKCARIIPLYAYQTFLESYTLEDYRAFKHYKEYSDEVLRPMFEETEHYATLHMDSVHDLFYIDYDVNKDTVFLEFKNIIDFEMVFQPKELTNGIAGKKVEGDVLVRLQTKIPYVKYEDKLKKDVKTKAKKEFFGTKITYENPKGMDDFLGAFLFAWVTSQNEDVNNTGDPKEHVSELEQAMALFMLDSLDGVTLEELKVHRNRLMKVFHPDKGSVEDTRYAQKINNAYEVLSAAVVVHH